jgi:dienelactone hydrolase
MCFIRIFCVLVLLPTLALGAELPGSVLVVGSDFAAQDTLECGPEDNEDARDCLANLRWEPATFRVTLEAAESGCGSFLVRFASPRPVGNAVNDLVAMEWFAARDEHGAICTAPAIVVVHESGRRMTVGRIVARGLNAAGYHAFLLHLPGFGARRVEPIEKDRVFAAMLQSIADVRRARDAVVALPAIDPSVIGVQGTSLGGFVVATTAGLDRGYDRVFIFLAGGDLQEVILRGSRDAAKLHAKLAAAGITDDQIKESVQRIEPLRLAHRIDPAKTWLYSGQFDDVVPARCSLALATAAKLAGDHHIRFPADHYSGVVYLPQLVEQVGQRMRQQPE